MTDIRVSVVVPTYKRPDLLRRCLKALLEQDFDPAAFEVIVVDDGADESNRQVVAEMSASAGKAAWESHFEAVEIPVGVALKTKATGVGTNGKHTNGSGRAQEPRGQAIPDTGYARMLPALHYQAVKSQGGPAAARNLGWRAAVGEIIAFTDDDCLPTPGWLKNGLKVFTDGVMGASGRLVVPLSTEPTDFEVDTAGLASSHFITANCFYRRLALQRVNGFDERFKLPWREDSDLYFNMIKCGYRLVEAPQAVVVHPVRSAPWGVSIRQQRKSMYNALIYKKHPSLYKKLLQGSPPWSYYAIVASLLVAGVGLLVGNRELSLLGAGFWSGMTLQLSAFRLRGKSHATEHVLEMLVTSAVIPVLSVFWRLWGALKYRVPFL